MTPPITLELHSSVGGSALFLVEGGGGGELLGGGGQDLRLVESPLSAKQDASGH